MSEQQFTHTIEEQKKQAKLNLLREMMNEVQSCFEEKTPQELFEIKNFIDSFSHEL